MKTISFGRFFASCALLASFTVGANADAFDGRCLLEVDGIRYLNGVCNISFSSDGEGSFSIGTDDARTRYFAYVNIYEGVAQGYWNGVDGGGHAHTELGVLERNGACWRNTRAEVCAWR